MNDPEPYWSRQHQPTHHVVERKALLAFWQRACYLTTRLSDYGDDRTKALDLAEALENILRPISEEEAALIPSGWDNHDTHMEIHRDLARGAQEVRERRGPGGPSLASRPAAPGS